MQKRIVVIGGPSLYEEIRNGLSHPLVQVERLSPDDPEGALRWMDPTLGLILVEVATWADLSTIQRVRPHTHRPIVAVAQQPVPSLVVKAIRSGATDFLSRPVDGAVLVSFVDGLSERPRRSPAGHSSRGPGTESRNLMILGSGQKMVAIRALIAKVADTDVPVLITGETGTGKELVARTIHACSSRRDGPFVKVNTAAIPAELLESELFGFEKGAFTGAYRKNSGKFELAHRGTLLLDEIGEMAPFLQAKLLHVLQDGEFCRIGGEELVLADTRVLATTNRTLEKEVEDGRFRKDLYYRLNVVTLSVPPLRERREDIPELAAYFLEKYSVKYNKKPLPLSAAAEAFIHSYRWPGNVRELENLIKKIVAYENETVPIAELQKRERWDASERGLEGFAGKETASLLKEVGKRAAQEAEKKLIMEVLQKNRWNRRRAAAILQISYRTLLYKIKQSRLDVNM